MVQNMKKMKYFFSQKLYQSMLLMGDTIGPNDETSITSIKVLVLAFVIYSSDTTINIVSILVIFLRRKKKIHLKNMRHQTQHLGVQRL